MYNNNNEDALKCTTLATHQTSASLSGHDYRHIETLVSCIQKLFTAKIYIFLTRIYHFVVNCFH